MDEWWFKATILHCKMMMFNATILYCKAILSRRQPGQLRWILLWIMPLVQDGSLYLLASSTARYHCTVKKWNEWCFRPRFCTVRLYWARTTWANKINFVMNHVLGAGSIAGPVDQQFSVPLEIMNSDAYEYHIKISPITKITIVIWTYQ